MKGRQGHTTIERLFQNGTRDDCSYFLQGWEKDHALVEVALNAQGFVAVIVVVAEDGSGSLEHRPVKADGMVIIRR